MADPLGCSQQHPTRRRRRRCCPLLCRAPATRPRRRAHSEYVKLLYNFVYEFIQSARPIQLRQSSGQIAVDMQPFAPPARVRANGWKYIQCPPARCPPAATRWLPAHCIFSNRLIHPVYFVAVNYSPRTESFPVGESV